MRRHLGKIVLVLLLIVAVVAALVGFGVFSPKSGHKEVAAADDKEAEDTSVDEEERQYFTITDADANRILAEYAGQDGSNEFYDWYLNPKAIGERTKYFSDAVSTEFKANSDEEMQKELEREFWHNPVMAQNAALKFRDLGEINGVVIAEENDWLTAFLNRFDKEGLKSFLERDDKDNLFVTPEYQEIAAKLIVLQQKFKGVGVKKIETTWHYPLKGSEFSVKSYRNTDPGYVDKEQSLNFVYVDKSGRTLVEYGYNLNDKRSEVFTDSGKPVQPKTPTSPPNQPTTPPAQPTQPPAQPTPTTPPEVLKKNPYADPVHHENAEKGGGEGTGETKSTPENDYTELYNGNSDNKGYAQPDEVKPDTPSANETAVNTDQNKEDYGRLDGTDSYGVGGEISAGSASLPD